MDTYFLMGKYSGGALKEMSPDRTQKAARFIDDLGGEVKAMYALLGTYDLVIIADLPKTEVAMKASLGLALLTGISFESYPAVAVDDFDRIIGEM